MLAWSMGGVGLIDITVGNGAPRRINVPPRDAARRTTSLRNARAAGDILAALARLARTVPLKRARGSETAWRLRATAVQRAADEIEFALRKDDDKARVLVTILQYACNDFE
jgi:Ser/Thr protein kinase RdoA (MazF antagonist)